MPNTSSKASDILNDLNIQKEKWTKTDSGQIVETLIYVGAIEKTVQGCVMHAHKYWDLIFSIHGSLDKELECT